MKYYCPMDNQQFDTAREAILCWMNDVPDLFRYYTLAHIARAIGGATRERVRQIANSLGNEKRKRKYKGAIRGVAAERRRKGLTTFQDEVTLKYAESIQEEA